MKKNICVALGKSSTKVLPVVLFKHISANSIDISFSFLTKSTRRLVSILKYTISIIFLLCYVSGVAQDNFITTWKTNNTGTSGNTSITIRTNSSLTYNYSVDWNNDGTMDETGLTGDVTHDFGAAGEYTIQITGTFPTIKFNNGGDKAKLIDVSQWGTGKWESMNNAFYGCSNLSISATDAPDLSTADNIAGMFRSCSNLSTEDFSGWDVSTIQYFTNCFRSSTFNGNISTWDMSSAINIKRMFRAASFDQDISGWDVSLVFNFYEMFRNSSFDQNIGDWNISSMSDAADMFINTSLSTENYDNTLIGWQNTAPSGITFNAGSSKYCTGQYARNYLTSELNWSINDSGVDGSCNDNTCIIATFEPSNSGTATEINIGANASTGYAVDWNNDGTYDEFNLTGNVFHDFGSTATQTIRIAGNFDGFDFSSSSQSADLVSIDQWGTIAPSTYENAFNGCENLVINATDTPDFSNATSTKGMFTACTNLSGNFVNWDFTEIETISSMFSDCFNFNGDISSWNVDEVTDMSQLFLSCQKFNGNLSSWNVEAVENASEMFHGASSFNQDISGWNVSAVSDMSSMFEEASSFDQNLGNWDITSVTTMNEMFKSVTMSTSNYDNTLIGWSAQNVQTGVVFDGGNSQYCQGGYKKGYLIAELNWTISDNGEDASCNDTECVIVTFEPSSSGTSTEVYIRANTSTGYAVDWDNDGTYDEFNLTGDISHDFGSTATQTVRITGDFDGFKFSSQNQSKDLVSIDQWGTIAPSTYENAFGGCENLVINATDTPDFSNATSTEGMFTSCYNLSGNFDNWDFTGITTMSGMFSGCIYFNGDLSSWNVEGVTDMSQLFTSCQKFNSDLSGWNVEDVENVSEMFTYCDDFNGNVSSWNLASATNMTQMFYYCSDFNSDITGWNFESAETMTEMFYGASSFNQDISGWNVSTVSDMSYMFEEAYDFDQNLGDWDISNVTTMKNMFKSITMSTSNYDSTLIGWSAQTVQSGVKFHGGNSQYCASIAERSMLKNNNSWSMSDGGNECSDTAFVFTVTISSTDFTIPTNSAFTYNYHVDWDNNGTYEDFNQSGDVSHDYGSAGTYTIAVIGEFPALYFNNNANKDDITDVSQWGKGEWESFEAAFYGCSNLNFTATDTPNLTNCTSTESAFREATSFDSDISLWDVSNITNMTTMFNGVTLSTSTYDNLLTSWAAQAVQTGVTFDGGNSQYCASETDRNTLTDVTIKNWTITDGGTPCVGTPFVIKISNADFTIPTNSDFTYNYHVDWESDGVYDEVGIIGNAYHDYGTDGTYTISILGDFPAIYFNNGGNDTELIEIVQWGGAEWESFEAAFAGCQNLTITATDQPDFSTVTNADYMFENCTNLSGNFEDWDLTGVTSAALMFEDCTNFDENISGWNVSTIESFYSFLDGASSFNQPLNDWNVSSATTMFRMFQDAFKFNQPLDNWIVSNVTVMGTMFKNATDFDQPLNDWDVSKVENMSSMFAGATSFNQDLNDWETTSLNNIGYMFYGATDFNGDVTTWDISSISGSQFRVFENSALDQNLGNWDVTKISSYGFYKMLDGVTMSTSNYDSTLIGWAAQSVNNGVYFSGGNSKYCLAINERSVLADDNSWNLTDGGFECTTEILKISVVTSNTGTSGDTEFTLPTNSNFTYNYHVDWESDGVIDDYNVTGDITHTYDVSGTYNISIYGTYPAFYFNNEGDAEKITEVTQWGTGMPWESFESAFYGCSNLSFTATDTPDLSNVTSMENAFREATSFDSDISSWDVSEMTTFSNAFRGASVFNQPLDTWDVSGALVMNSMFYSASLFNQDLNSWDVDSVTDMTNMFREASVFNGDISSWRTDKLISMTSMFFQAANFNQAIDGWNVSNVTSLRLVFREATKFNQDLGTWEVDNVTDMFCTFLACEDLNQNFSNWNVGKVENMEGLFFGCKKFDGDITNWNVSNVENMGVMFAYCNVLNQDLSKWDVGNVTTMYGMFYDCELFNADLSKWDVGNVMNMSQMFDYAVAFDQNLGEWNVSNVTDFSNMFSNISSLSSTNYDNLLIGWNRQNLNASESINISTTEYCAASGANTNLQSASTHGWSISDGGQGDISIDSSLTRGYMLTLNGATDYVSMGHTTVSNFVTTEAFSGEAWIKLNAPTIDQHILGKFTGGSNPQGWSFMVLENSGNPTLAFQMSGGTSTDQLISTPTTTPILNAGEWYHVAFVYDGSNTGTGTTFYINGISYAGEEYASSPASSVTGSIQNDSSFTIGGNANGEELFNGSIDEVRLWLDERTMNEIRQNMHIAMELSCTDESAGYWQFNLSDGTTATDYSSFGNDGTHVGNPSIVESEVSTGYAWSTSHNATTTNTVYSSNSLETDVSLDLSFTTTAPGDDLVVTYIEGLPVGGAPATSLENIPLGYWVVDNYGTNTGLGAEATFHFEDGTITNEVLESHALHKRGSMETGTWTQNNSSAVATSSTAGSNYTKFDNIDGFSMLFSSFTSSILPVTWLSFDLIHTEENINVSWSTVTEMNNKEFVIEKLEEGEWKEIGIVEGNNTSLTTHHYMYTDSEYVIGQTMYYRIKQVDIDGEYSYSEVKSIYVNSTNSLSVYPNPSNGNFTVNFLQEVEQGNVKIVDINGRVILTQEIEYLSELTIDFDELKQGIYFIQAYLDNQQYYTKIVIEK